MIWTKSLPKQLASENLPSRTRSTSAAYLAVVATQPVCLEDMHLVGIPSFAISATNRAISLGTARLLGSSNLRDFRMTRKFDWLLQLQQIGTERKLLLEQGREDTGINYG
jgi:hypothetical protein